MFWIGLIIGIIVGIIGIMVVSTRYVVNLYGSWEAFDKGTDLLEVATNNRESVMRVYHDGEVLDEVIFEELG